MTEQMELDAIGYFGDETEADTDTLKALTGLCEKMTLLRADKDALEDKVSAINTELKAIEEKIIQYFKEYGLPSLKTDAGTFSIIKRKSFTQPATPEDRVAFYKYLQEKGLFESMISVNSRTLSSWAGKEVEAMAEQGNANWLPPGLKAPHEYETIGIRKK